MNDDIVMTEEEAKKALFDLNFEYMKHSPKERLKLYDEYKENREKIKKALKRAKIQELDEAKKIKQKIKGIE